MAETRGSRLRMAMQAHGLSKLSAMAAAVGVSDSAISRWCHDGPMTLENVVALSEVLEVSIDWLLLGRGPMQQHDIVASTCHPQIARAVAQMKPHVREHLSRFLSTVQEERGDGDQ